MIFDRTINDVIQAENIFENKLKKFEALTDADKNILERGRITINTINRIEAKQKELSEILFMWCYLKENMVNKQWKDSDFFVQKDLNRLVENTKNIKNSFYVTSTDIKEPEPIFYFKDFNTIEQILFEVSALISETEKSFKRSGTVNSNQSALPV